MSTIVLIVLSAIAAILARTIVNHSLILAAVIVVASASAADALVARTTDGVRSVVGDLTVKAQ